jgi:hypothetical protein
MQGFRTIVINGVIAILAMLSARFDWVDIGADDQGAIAAAVAVVAVNLVNIGLRFVTSTPIFKKLGG